MQEFLKRRNQQLIRDVEILLHSVSSSEIPDELQSYKRYIIDKCQHLKNAIRVNLKLLSLGQADILEDILSNTKQITNSVQLLSSYLAIPILRASVADRLCISILDWLHQQHPQTMTCPPAIVSGSCSILPFEVPIYFFSAVEQRGLLHQPLLFHEFGHFLYVHHKPEMDDLVAELRQEVIDLLIPASQRNDRYAEEQVAKRQLIADTWYHWIQEMFCDAVGFEIGGPSFLLSLSSFLNTLSREDFYRQPQDLWFTTHPVTWLRVRFLVERARNANFCDLADMVEAEWLMAAQMMGIEEDYHGFYHETLSETIRNTIEDMLVEASPRQYTSEEANGGDWGPISDTPIRLLNWAWQVYLGAPEKYTAWETKQIQKLLKK